MLTRLATLAIPMTLVALSGCAGLVGSARSPSWPWPNPALICKQATCDAAEGIAAFNAASIFCKDAQNYYESGSQLASSTKIAIGAVGSVAGAVIAPIAHGSAATAWSGLSGTTNALQMSIEEAFSATVAVKRRAKIAEKAAQEADTVAKQANTNLQVFAAINMARACAMSSAEADAEAIRALAK